MPIAPLPASDLAEVLSHAGPAFLNLRDARIFLAGGTGLFGHWLLESLLHADDALVLNTHTTVLTRDPEAFRARSPHIANHRAVTLLGGDVRSFPLPAGTYTHILHAATDSSTSQDISSVVTGTERVLALAAVSGSPRLLYVSTGAVYGRSTAVPHTPESFILPELPAGSYEAAKLAAEGLCLASGVPTVIARCFSFVGPHLPLDRHFAIGNFVGAALAGRPIRILGDGTPRRSWMYMSDLATWLWTLLALGKAGRAYNVGSDESFSISEAARLTAATLHPGLPIEVLGRPDPAAAPQSYVPEISRAREELNLRVTVSLAEALRRTAAWYPLHPPDFP